MRSSTISITVFESARRKRRSDTENRIRVSKHVVCDRNMHESSLSFSIKRQSANSEGNTA